jgi:uncharacterized protein YjiS (DUF1127 family)
MKMQMTYDTRAAHMLPRTETANPQTTNLMRSLLGMLATWSYRHAERRAMRQIDDHLLRDIGLNRVQVEAMAARPFWRA